MIDGYEGEGMFVRTGRVGLAPNPREAEPILQGLGAFSKSMKKP